MRKQTILILLILTNIWNNIHSCIRKLKRKISKLEKYKKGGNQMSKILQDLIGRKVKLTIENELNESVAIIEAVDDEWLRYTKISKKGNKISKIIRTDFVYNIEILGE